MLNAMNNYWAVAGRQDIYASARNIYVAPDDADLVAWLVLNSLGTPIASEAEIWPYVSGPPRDLPHWLFDGTTFAQPAVDAYSKTQLASYAAVARDARLTGGIVVNGLPFATDPYTFMSLNSAHIYTQAQTGSEFSWKLPDGSFVTLNKMDIAALHNASNTFGQNCYACEDTTLTGIEGGTITTLAAIDAAFAAVSNNFTGAAMGMEMSELKVRHAPKKVVK